MKILSSTEIIAKFNENTENHIYLLSIGYVYRDYREVPIGLKPVIIRMKVQRLYCEDCGITRQEEIRIADKKKLHTWIPQICIEFAQLYDG